ncbi:MAG: DOPA 4,5-dioxygenase family protein [Sphingomonadaceae bacterium]|jgi:DOPA 4,5-dioxygenase
MAEIESIHAHIYFDPPDLAAAQALARAAAERFDLRVGRFHEKPVGPHPRGSCQLTVAPQDLGGFVGWAAQARGGLTIFTHLETGNDLADHTQHVIWLGPSEPLDIAQFGG